MLSTPALFVVGICGVILASIVIFGMSGSFFSVFAMLLLVGVGAYFAVKSGVIHVQTTADGLDVSLYESAPIPATKSSPLSIEQKEVFYISGNNYEYEEAAAVCAAYDSELATYDQVQDAYGKGAEWCGYGWSQGGMALFPTQESTWQKLQLEGPEKSRTACGRPGVNGGYFDPSTKFGVNCFGIKPKGNNVKLPLPLPGTNEGEFDKMVQKFKSMLNKMSVSPFSRATWSEWNVGSYINGLPSKHANPTKPTHS